mmetsp:Transcript_477/g.1491  ORF Transcript_477/g.1491 Transcript_477/m.1491 type:complete len:249 (-) Transcript_477:91-837(-)
MPCSAPAADAPPAPRPPVGPPDDVADAELVALACLGVFAPRFLPLLVWLWQTRDHAADVCVGVAVGLTMLARDSALAVAVLTRARRAVADWAELVADRVSKVLLAGLASIVVASFLASITSRMEHGVCVDDARIRNLALMAVSLLAVESMLLLLVAFLSESGHLFAQPIQNSDQIRQTLFGLPLPQRFDSFGAAEQERFRVCAICLESFDGADKVARLPCKHMFHESCAGAWFSRSSACPLRCLQVQV